MRRHPRLVALAALLLVVALTFVTAWGLVFLRPLPTIDGAERLLGLHERAEVLRDEYGVPHIFAADDHDLFFLQGYVTAQDRLWQMDVYRRAAQGRLAEVLGEPGLESDRFMRTIGLGRAARLDRSALSPATLAHLQAFADGVNKFLEQHGDSLPVEFLILGYKPARWEIDDTLAIAKLQLYDAAGNYTIELLRASIAERLGLDVLPVLMPDPGAAVAYDARAWAAVAPELAGVRAPGVPLAAILGGAGEGRGSNCWALAGSKTRSGKPLLAGDPHLPVRNPSIWYEIALAAGDHRLIGFSIPGVPGVVIGHNDHVAWSFTYAYADTQDLFVERVDPSDLRRYEYRGGFELATFVREEIAVKGRAEPVVLDVAVTRHGPILTPVLEGQRAQVALRWSALDASRTVDAVMGMNRARSWDDFRRAAADFTGAALSACYADTSGHIGYLLVGRLPDRPGDGRLPVPGWTGEHEWRGLLPADRNPSLLDPPGGVIVNANNRPVASPADTGWMGEWDPGFRYAHLRAQLERTSGADVAAMSRLQNDYSSPPVGRFRDALAAAKPATALGQQLLRIAVEWDGALGVDSAGAAVYEAWLVELGRLVFEDKLGAVYEDYATHGRLLFALHELLDERSSTWFTALGDPSVTGRDAVAGAALDRAGRSLAARLGTDVARWRWGDLHTVSFEHPLSAAKPLDLIFTIGPVRRAGDGYSPNNGAYSLTKPFTLRAHASERQIADLADLDASVSILPVGQSGQPFSRNWGDQTKLWAEGKTKPMALSRERIGPLAGLLVVRPR